MSIDSESIKNCDNEWKKYIHTHTYTHTLYIYIYIHTHIYTYILHKGCMLAIISCVSVWLFETQQTVACKAPLSMRFSRQEYWSGLPCPPPGHLPNPGIKPESLTSLALAGFTTSTTWEAQYIYIYIYKQKLYMQTLNKYNQEAMPGTMWLWERPVRDCVQSKITTNEIKWKRASSPSFCWLCSFSSNK